MDLESPAEVGGDDREVFLFSFFGLSVAWVKQEHMLRYCSFLSTLGLGEASI